MKKWGRAQTGCLRDCRVGDHLGLLKTKTLRAEDIWRGKKIVNALVKIDSERRPCWDFKTSASGMKTMWEQVATDSGNRESCLFVFCWATFSPTGLYLSYYCASFLSNTSLLCVSTAQSCFFFPAMINKLTAKQQQQHYYNVSAETFGRIQ